MESEEQLKYVIHIRMSETLAQFLEALGEKSQRGQAAEIRSLLCDAMENRLMNAGPAFADTLEAEGIMNNVMHVRIDDVLNNWLELKSKQEAINIAEFARNILESFRVGRLVRVTPSGLTTTGGDSVSPNPMQS